MIRAINVVGNWGFSCFSGHKTSANLIHYVDVGLNLCMFKCLSSLCLFLSLAVDCGVNCLLIVDGTFLTGRCFDVI